jgi:hypothetical protein
MTKEQKRRWEESKKKVLKLSYEKQIEAIKDNIKALYGVTKNERSTDSLFSFVDHIIVSEPTIIVFFKDGTKEISKPSKNDTYNETIGILICILKHFSSASQTQFGKELEELSTKITYQDPCSNKEVKELNKKIQDLKDYVAELDLQAKKKCE